MFLRTPPRFDDQITRSQSDARLQTKATNRIQPRISYTDIRFSDIRINMRIVLWRSASMAFFGRFPLGCCCCCCCCSFCLINPSSSQNNIPFYTNRPNHPWSFAILYPIAMRSHYNVACVCVCAPQNLQQQITFPQLLCQVCKKKRIQKRDWEKMHSRIKVPLVKNKWKCDAIDSRNFSFCRRTFLN